MTPQELADVLCNDTEFVKDYNVFPNEPEMQLYAVRMHGTRLSSASTLVSAMQGMKIASLLTLRHILPGQLPIPYGRIIYDLDVNTKEKPPMKFIEHKTFINGTDVKNLSNDQLLGIIAGKQAELKKYDELGAKVPKRLQKHVAKIRADLDELVKVMDDADAKDAAEKAAEAAPAVSSTGQ